MEGLAKIVRSRFMEKYDSVDGIVTKVGPNASELIKTGMYYYTEPTTEVAEHLQRMGSGSYINLNTF